MANQNIHITYKWTEEKSKILQEWYEIFLWTFLTLTVDRCSNVKIHEFKQSTPAILCLGASYNFQACKGWAFDIQNTA